MGRIMPKQVSSGYIRNLAEELERWFSSYEHTALAGDLGSVPLSDVLYQPLTPDSGSLALSSDHHRHRAHRWDTHINADNTHIKLNK